MAIERVGAVAGAGHAPAPEGGSEKFGKVMESVGKGGQQQGPQVGSETAPRPVVDAQKTTGAQKAKAGCVTGVPGVSEAKSASPAMATPPAKHVEAAKMLDQVNAAQRRLDHILELAQGGKNFSPAELMAMQAHVYRASQELDLAGKVVEKATAGMKQILQTQL